MSNCTIFIPSYQAAPTLPFVVERIPEGFWPSVERVLVINDGSTDDTDDVVRGLQERWPKLELVSQPTNQGYGAAVSTLR